MTDDCLDFCLNCGVIWGMDEINDGRCKACGWREGDPLDIDDGYDDERDELYFDEDRYVRLGHEDEAWHEEDDE